MEKSRLERLQERKQKERRQWLRRCCWGLFFIVLLAVGLHFISDTPGSPAQRMDQLRHQLTHQLTRLLPEELPTQLFQGLRGLLPWNRQTDAPFPAETGPAASTTTSEEADASTDASFRVLFLGDNMMAGRVAAVMDEKGMHYPLQEFAPLLEEVDLIVANLETAVGTSGQMMEKSFAFQTAPRYLDLFDPYREKLVFTLANNHGMDGPALETMSALESAGFHYVGLGRDREAAYAPYVGEINGVSFAIFGASRVIPVASWRAGENHPGMATVYNPESLLEHVVPWVGEVDYVITYLHWGVELADKPEPYQLALEEALYEAGVNLVIGSHPHVLQAFEWRGPKAFTAYSLGNFVFTTSHDPMANDTGALELVLSPDAIETAVLHPAQVRWGLVRYLTDPTERQRIIQRVNRLSESVRVDDDGMMQRLSH
ncbi:CapA family protein [Anoxynatronum buryatiense]|uniref:Poly-gamma-glutamate synthesis protein (Capsule biosynthesis protein) n=1 Tax=Anoxynatronum buryatiense TaxID=489973 RepID=A0AA45WXU9_9CLOT|nr:CapA family protein [Anoxynatronum buryatiense]SMP66204.1 poly-gamma-glutamate synthesis protein (capsule biosynthesis protein) [Anoxynatronum buryatiense]